MKSKMRTDKIEKALKGVHVKKALAKSSTVLFRVSEVDKQDIADTAKSLKMNVSEYMVNAHRLIKSRLK